ncbi:hypothetical protein [Mesorhizobium sp. L2C066B000]|uniref:hypothetical protein n=1 Tax=Mesorhizobium sp. L2C066B000 TaxID=1287105 RepID=UPI0018C9C2F9|nr:hypothetical protein [Mesorhizobium sp. L2C066B000]
MQQVEIAGFGGNGDLQRFMPLRVRGARKRGNEGQAGCGGQEIAAVESHHVSSPFCLIGNDHVHAC